MPACMNKYKNDFTINFAQLMQAKLPIWKKTQKEKLRSLYSIGAICGYLGVAALGFVPGKREHNYDLKLHCGLAVIFFIGAIIANIQTTNKEYQRKIKSTLFPALLKVFGNINYVKSSGLHQNLSNSVFENSQLYTRKITQRDDDDCFRGDYNDVKFAMTETDFGWNANDKHRTYHSMFKGLAMHFTLNKEIKSRVLILTKYSFTRIPQNYEKVEVEYEKFNKKYDVWVEKNIMGGTGQIEARYLLNTAFLDRFMQIQTSFRVKKMCCSVFGNEMLIMLSTNKDLFEMNHLFFKIDDLRQYEHLFNEFASVLSFIEVLNLSSKTGL